MTEQPYLVWLKHDLRLSDNPALRTAVDSGRPVIPVFIWSPEEEGRYAPGEASRWYLHQSLQKFQANLEAINSRLIIRKGPTPETLDQLIHETQACGVYSNLRYEPALIDRDRKIKSKLLDQGIEAKTFNASLLFDPLEIKTKTGTPFQVFTPYWKTCLKEFDPPEPFPKVRRIPPPKTWPPSLEIRDLALEPALDWIKGLENTWETGEQAAMKTLNHFLKNKIADYEENRNRPDLDGVSRLSPYLHFGEISPRTVWHKVIRQLENFSNPNSKESALCFLRELGWREFSYHLLYHFPSTPNQSLRKHFREFPWRKSLKDLRAWQEGKTGYPIVDAGMRQLWKTGWMHNRVRMIVGSFLVKDLLIPWQRGAEWFWDTLVDADLANNTMGWQWVAGCGADAAPFFRVFNPVLQGKKFDPEGHYVKQYLPELQNLPATYIHEPWKAPSEILRQAGVQLGRNYPKPIVDHAIARDHALRMYKQFNK